MPKQKRHKTKYPGVYYVLGGGGPSRLKSRIYYILFRKNGKLVEEKAGHQHNDKMTPYRAARMRELKITGHLPLNKEPRIAEAQRSGSVPSPDNFKPQFKLYGESNLSLAKLDRILAAIFHVSSDGLSICDAQGNVLACNQAMSRLTGLDNEEFVGKNTADLVKRGVVDKSVSQQVLSTKSQANTMILIKPTNKQTLSTGTPVFDENGAIEMIIINDRDMSQLNRMKAELDQSRLVTQKYKDRLAEINMLKSKGQTIVATSEKMRQVLKTGHRFAKLGVSNVLLVGESGTGKNLLARFIHDHGRRKKQSFIEINCAAIPENLIEAELFGYEKGAFTGADPRGKVGLFELAHKGTLFLDEIGDMSLSTQVKLLKYLDNQEIKRIGGIKPIRVNCFVTAATNKNIKEMVSKGSFREDLFYRLNAVNLSIAPLRERPEDIIDLAFHFLEHFNQTYGLNKRLSPKAIESLLAYHLPGNTRELKNIINSAVLMSEHDTLVKSIVNAILDLKISEPPPSIRENRELKSAPNLPQPGATMLNQDVMGHGLKEQLSKVEKSILTDALARLGSTRKVAEYLELSQSSVVRKLKRHGLSSYLENSSRIQY